MNLTGVRAGDRNMIAVTLTAKGEPLNLAGMTLAAQARKKVTDTEIAVSAVIEMDPDPATGKFVMTWPGDQVRTSLAEKASWAGVWDLQATNAEGDTVTLAAGSFAVVLDVTRD